MFFLVLYGSSFSVVLIDSVVNMCVCVYRLIFVQLCLQPRGLLEMCTISVVFFFGMNETKLTA
jgi:hypothetical protein